MKKYLSLFLLALVLTGTSVVAQSLQLVDLPTGPVTGAPTDDLITGKLSVKNISSSAKSVLVKMDTVSIAKGHTGYFCWGACYPPGVLVSPDAVTIPAGAKTAADIFYADLIPDGKAGTSVVRFTYYVATNPKDSATYTFTFVAGTTGVRNMFSPSTYAILSSAFPSPASSYTRIAYNLPSANANAQLVVYSLLGHELQTIPLNDQQGTVVLETSSYNPGMYFYAIVADGKRIAAERFLIKR